MDKNININLLDAYTRARKALSKATDVYPRNSNIVFTVPVAIIDAKTLEELLDFIDGFYDLESVDDSMEFGIAEEVMEE